MLKFVRNFLTNVEICALFIKESNEKFCQQQIIFTYEIHVFTGINENNMNGIAGSYKTVTLKIFVALTFSKN